ncbi:hypothetical protein [Aliagarivorans taiwanensis]|uniref:hypothetical protein n=1 Tax=Aliagarivorans taiwanensis TaxID=561966 RepID=UPI000419FB0B|nr:hypothetical protein [Aliagarivorans taiwanensis]
MSRVKRSGMPLVTTLLATALLFTSGYSAAALAPNYQNLRDLDAMLDYMHEHPEVAARLDSIDMRDYVIHYDDNCRIEFMREARITPPGWAGPEAPLVFKTDSCSSQRATHSQLH